MLIYFAIIPSFYVFKSIVYDGGSNPLNWLKSAKKKMGETWTKDVKMASRLWIPVDFICFTVGLHWRLPLRQFFSFMWTMWFSFMRGEKKSR